MKVCSAEVCEETLDTRPALNDLMHETPAQATHNKHSHSRLQQFILHRNERVLVFNERGSCVQLYAQFICVLYLSSVALTNHSVLRSLCSHACNSFRHSLIWWQWKHENRLALTSHVFSANTMCVSGYDALFKRKAYLRAVTLIYWHIVVYIDGTFQGHSFTFVCN